MNLCSELLGGVTIVDERVLMYVHLCAGGADRETLEDFDDRFYLMLDPHLRPLEPDRTNPESVMDFKEHKEVSTKWCTLCSVTSHTFRWARVTKLYTGVIKNVIF